jgi:hypothetical protein
MFGFVARFGVLQIIAHFFHIFLQMMAILATNKNNSQKKKNPRETFCNLAQLQYPKSATTIPKTFQKVTADNFPQWVFSGAKVAELRHTQSGPDPARHPVLHVGYPGSPFRARMS